MKLTRKQAQVLRNAIAAEFDPFHDPYKMRTSASAPKVLDPTAWEGADIPTRESIEAIVRKIRKA